MANLTVWRFNDANGAASVVAKLTDLQKRGLISVQDGAVVSWEEGKRKPKTQQLNDLAAAGALNGAFWGMLFGMLFFIPLLGAAMGALAGGLGGSLGDIGIDDEFIREVRDQVTPGTSALFLLTSGAVRDRLVEHFEGIEAELIHTNLSAEDEAKLREAFEA